VPLHHARLNLIQAEWDLIQHRSPVKILASAQQQIEDALALNPHSASAYLLRAEVELLSIQWNDSKEPNAHRIRRGLDAIEKAIQIKADSAKAYCIRGRLLLHQAALDPSRKSILATEAVNDFERAFALNSLLQATHQGYLNKARSLH
jgi:hypothetical protein